MILEALERDDGKGLNDEASPPDISPSNTNPFLPPIQPLAHLTVALVAHAQGGLTLGREKGALDPQFLDSGPQFGRSTHRYICQMFLSATNSDRHSQLHFRSA